METQRKVPIPRLLAIETRLCMERLATLAPGEIVTYEELNGVCGCDVQKRRYVLSTSIGKLLAEEAKVFIAENRVGIRRLTNEEIPEVGHRDLGRLGRMARRSVRRLSAVEYDKLSQTHKIMHNTSMTVLALVQQSASRKAIGQIEKAVTERTSALPMNDTLRLFGGS